MFPSCASLLLIFGHLADPAFDAPGPIPFLPPERVCGLTLMQAQDDWCRLHTAREALGYPPLSAWRYDCLTSQLEETNRLWAIWDAARRIQMDPTDPEERERWLEVLADIEPEGFLSGRLPLPLSSRGWR